MTRAYSADLRQRVLADCDAGLATGAAARKYTVSPAWVRRLKQRRRETGEVGPRQGTPGPARKLAGPGDEALAALAKAEPDLSAAEYRDRLGTAACAVTVWRALRRLGLTFKKKC
jgi:transposase